MYNEANNTQVFYHFLLKEAEKAHHCVECGQCEQSCPQQIPVRQMLKEVITTFGR
jgi:predicted aldo/keto reductase-like oxidoreductase